jgi:predicted permease
MFGPNGGRTTVSVDTFRAWRSSAVFDAVEAANPHEVLIETGAGPVSRNGARVTPGLFEMLGVRAIRGRVFQPGDGRAGTDDGVLLSEDFWRSTLAADPDVIGSRITLNGEVAHVIGVLPADFRFPAWDTQVWTPIDYDDPPPARTQQGPLAVVRTARGVPQVDALRVATEAARAADSSVAELNATALPIAGFRYNDYYERAIPLLFGGVGLVFLVLCANVSSLLLVRLGARRREFGLCSALGASRGRLLRQALAESAMLGAIGTLAGVGLAALMVSVSRAVLPEAFMLRTLNPLDLDGRALLVASAFGVLATIVAGVLPAWIGTRLAPSESIRLAERGGTESRASRVATRGLLVTEIALACTLLVGATKLARSFVNLAAAERGLDTEGVIIASISLSETDFPDADARNSMRVAIDAELRGLAGVQQLVLTYGIPPDGSMIHFGDDWRSDLAGAQALDLTVDGYRVGADYFALYGIPLLRGRTFVDGDTPYDVVVGQRLADLFWPGVDPVGHAFFRGERQYRVVGVVAETNLPSIDATVDRPEFYEPLRALGNYFTASLRCGAECPGPAEIRQRLLRLSALIGVGDVGPLDAKYFEQLAQPRAAAAMGSTFAVIALIAAAGGLFSVLSFAVGRRRREFGIRTAMGASPAQLRRLVLRDGLAIAAAGIVVGSGFAWVLARSLTALQYGVTPADPVTWLTVASVLMASTLLAAWRPARQAAKTDPVALLRDE